MTAQSRLCVVIPVYNGSLYIGAALQSLFAQTDRDFEVVVVDDGSTDATREIVERIIEERGDEPPTIHLVQQDRQGPSAARNRAIAKTSAPLIGFLDADDLWHPTKVAEHVQFLEANPEVHLTFSGFRFIGPDGADLHEPNIPASENLSYEKLLERNCIHTSTVVVRRETLIATGCFDPSLRTYEDYDQWLRIAILRDDATRAIRRVLTDYRRHAVQATRNWTRMHQGWLAVAARQRSLRPEVWSRVEPIARANQYQYCAALAYNAGDIPSARALIRQCWQAGGIRLARSPEVMLVTAICISTYLPRLLQIPLGYSYSVLRRARLALFRVSP